MILVKHSAVSATRKLQWREPHAWFQSFLSAHKTPILPISGSPRSGTDTCQTFMTYTLPFGGLGSPGQFRVFREGSHFCLSNEWQDEYGQDIDRVGNNDFYLK